LYLVQLLSRLVHPLFLLVQQVAVEILCVHLCSHVIMDALIEWCSALMIESCKRVAGMYKIWRCRMKPVARKFLSYRVTWSLWLLWWNEDFVGLVGYTFRGSVSLKVIWWWSSCRGGCSWNGCA
jgi:hypothetical protein